MTNVSSEAVHSSDDFDESKAGGQSNQTREGVLKGLVFEVRRFCLHDGPGIRTTVFFKGCPLACQWCHNPEGRNFAASLMYYEERCRHFGDCIPACPNHAIRDVKGKVQTGPECQACGTCVEACPSGARQIAGRWMTVNEILKQAERDLVFFDESKGGVTFSGGEPFYQPRFLSSLLDAFRQKQIHTTIETCGFAKSELFKSLKDRVDLFLFDVKILDLSKHEHYTGVSNDLILTNLEDLARGGSRVIVRVPLITTVNDSDEEIRGLGRLLREFRIFEVHLLPYHASGTGKYARLKMPYLLGDLVSPAPESVARLGRILEGFGMAVTIGGQS